MGRRFAAGLAVALASLAIAAGAGADTLIDHVNGTTPDGRGGTTSFTGLVIGNDGRVAALLHAGERRPRTTYARDGKNAVIAPAIVLPAVQLMRLGLALIANGRPLAALPPPRPEDRDVALAAAQAALLARGIITVADMGETIEDWQALRRAGDAGRLTIRVIAFADGPGQAALIGGPGPGPWLYDGHLKAQGVWIDAGDIAQPRALIAAKNRMSEAALDHFQVALNVPAADDAAAAAAVAELGQTYPGDRRWLVSHSPPIDAVADLPDAARAANSAPLDVARSAHDLFADGLLGCLNPGCRADFLMSSPGTPESPGNLREVAVAGVRVAEAPAPSAAQADAPVDARGTSTSEGR